MDKRVIKDDVKVAYRGIGNEGIDKYVMRINGKKQLP